MTTNQRFCYLIFICKIVLHDNKPKILCKHLRLKIKFIDYIKNVDITEYFSKYGNIEIFNILFLFFFKIKYISYSLFTL